VLREWLEKMNTTFSPLFEEVSGTYDLIICGGAATLIEYGWKSADFSGYLSNLVSNLKPGGIFVILENEKTDNIFVNMLFQEVLGFSRVT
jgi:hypothetical protein